MQHGEIEKLEIKPRRNLYREHPELFHKTELLEPGDSFVINPLVFAHFIDEPDGKVVARGMVYQITQAISRQHKGRKFSVMQVDREKTYRVWRHKESK